MFVEDVVVEKQGTCSFETPLLLSYEKDSCSLLPVEVYADVADA